MSTYFSRNMRTRSLSLVFAISREIPFLLCPNFRRVLISRLVGKASLFFFFFFFLLSHPALRLFSRDATGKITPPFRLIARECFAGAVKSSRDASTTIIFFIFVVFCTTILREINFDAKKSFKN